MKEQLKIGYLKLKNRVFLAPMHQVNDIAFRLLCKKAGATLTYTGLTNPQTHEEIKLDDKPAVQFACDSPKSIKEFIKKYDKKIALYDFNLGCPSPHAKQSHLGYFMISNYRTIKEILSAIRKNTKKPLTLKIRKMPDEQLKRIISIAERYCDAICVHPRTQSQGYSGIPDLEFAKRVKQQTKLPIVYSGNIANKEQAEKMLEEFDFIMIGRAAIGNPSIFSDSLGKKIKKRLNFYDWLKLAKKYKPYFNQIKFQAINFTQGFEGAPKIRHKLSLAKSKREILDILKESD